MGYLLSLQWWYPWCSINEVSYDFIPFWVQAHEVPLEALNAKAATKVGGKIGGLIEVEEPVKGGQFLRSFLHMRILTNVREPLVTRFWVPRRERSQVWVWSHYEKLQIYCYNCGRIGHESQYCKKKRPRSLFNPKLPRFGLGMELPPARAL